MQKKSNMTGVEDGGATEGAEEAAAEAEDGEACWTIRVYFWEGSMGTEAAFRIVAVPSAKTQMYLASSPIFLYMR